MEGIWIEAGEGGFFFDELEVGMAFEELSDADLIFFGPDTAGAVDELAAFFEEGAGIFKDSVLDFGEGGEMSVVLEVPGLGSASEDAAVTAGRVDEDAVEVPLLIGGDVLEHAQLEEPDVADTAALEELAEGSYALIRGVHSDDAAVADAFLHLEGFGAEPAAAVEYDLSGLDLQLRDDLGGGGILDLGDSATGPFGEEAGLGGRDDEEAGALVRGDGDVGGVEGVWGDAAVESNDGGWFAVIVFAELEGIGGLEERGEAFVEFFGVGEDDLRIGQRVGGTIGSWGVGFAGCFSEHGVDEAGGVGVSDAFGLFDGFVDNGGGGDAAEESELIESDGEDFLGDGVNAS